MLTRFTPRISLMVSYRTGSIRPRFVLKVGLQKVMILPVHLMEHALHPRHWVASMA